MAAGPDTTLTVRINTITKALQDKRDVPAELVFYKRCPMTPALEGEIMARFIGRVMMADLIADDAKANVYSTGKFQLESTGVPNIKIGRMITQETLMQLAAVKNNAYGGDGQALEDFWYGRVDQLLLGVRQRIETLLVAMHLDTFTYNRFGIQMTNTSWGMPSDLKITPSVLWTDLTNADAVNDVLTAKLVARTRYGKELNRMRMTTPAFRTMIQGTKFQNQTRAFLAPNVSYVNIPIANLEQQKNLAQNVLGMNIELYDTRPWTYATDGSIASAAFLPMGSVILDNPENDNNAEIQDFANGILAETIVGQIMPGAGLDGIPVGSRGPVGYATHATHDLNPAGIVLWGVARGFPRKKQLQANAVLNVGTITDPIPVTEPFG